MQVLERRTGIPITLSLVYMEVAQRVGLPMMGVNLPSHFMMQPDVEGVEFLVDAFHRGEMCYVQVGGGAQGLGFRVLVV